MMAYDRTFSTARAPYLIAYATYVSATIHTRIAAQTGPASEALVNLKRCLAVLDRNQTTNWGVSSARMSLGNLITRLGVECDIGDASIPGRQEAPVTPVAGDENVFEARPQLQSPGGMDLVSAPTSARPVETTMGHMMPDIDIDMILQSFAGGDTDFGFGPAQFDISGSRSTSLPDLAGGVMPGFEETGLEYLSNPAFEDVGLSGMPPDLEAPFTYNRSQDNE